MDDLVETDPDTFNELMDQIDRLSLGLNLCKLRNCNWVDKYNAVGQNILVDMLERGIDLDANFEEFESIDDAIEMADQLIENALNR